MEPSRQLPTNPSEPSVLSFSTPRRDRSRSHSRDWSDRAVHGSPILSHEQAVRLERLEEVEEVEELEEVEEHGDLPECVCGCSEHSELVPFSSSLFLVAADCIHRCVCPLCGDRATGGGRRCHKRVRVHPSTGPYVLCQTCGDTCLAILRIHAYEETQRVLLHHQEQQSQQAESLRSGDIILV